MTDLTRKAGDPLGVVVPVTVGVTPRTLMIPEAVQVVAEGDEAWPVFATVGTSRVWLISEQSQQDISHLWPEKPCPESYNSRPHVHYPYPTWCSGTVRPLPKPGEWWIVGHRPCELMPVVDKDDVTNRRPHIVEARHAPGRLLLCTPTTEAHSTGGKIGYHEAWATEDITSHFPDGLPTTDDPAGVCGELVLADEAKRVEP